MKGKYLERRVCFPGVQFELRTNEEFLNKADEGHHNRTRALICEMIPEFDCLRNVIIDYMHGVLLGIIKKLVILWTTLKNCEFSLSANQNLEVTKRINAIGQLPNEFSRKPRNLKYLNRYKATELWHLLLYTLPSVVAKGISKTRFYNHFMLLHQAIRILYTQNVCVTYINVASALLVEFLSGIPKFYGRYEVKFNAHSLLHLCSDVMFTKPLDSYSSFKFENHMQILKKVRVLEQMVNRNAEKKFLWRNIPHQKHNKAIELRKTN